MKIQELAIIFIIIILPISLVLSVYTQNQVQTINTQTLYDNRLTSATYDAMRAYQLNAANSTTSDMSNSKTRDIEASVSAFRNSIMTAFELNGFTANELNSYIPALVYTMYDGLYIYSPYSNIAEVNTDANADEEVKIKTEGQKEYGLKPYISYSCRYKTTNIDVVITYSLDNHIAVKGMIGRKYVNKEGYLIDGIECSINPDEEIKINDEIEKAKITYNGIEIGTESLKEYLPLSIDKNDENAAYPYAKINGTKYYLIHDDKEGCDQIVYVSNGFFRTQCKSTDSDKTAFNAYKNIIENNYMAKEYYYEAYKFTHWFKESGLSALTYGDAWDEVLVKNSDGSGTEQEYREIWPENSTPIFQFNSSSDIKNNIENETSTFNQHRLAVIRYKIENNLAIAISNYNKYSGVKNVFQMPELKEDEWDQIIHNISLISFLQGLPIGEKTYNGYTLVTNSESEEVVLEGNIFMLGESANGEKVYYRIGDVELEDGGTATLNAGNYGDKVSAGRLNLDFKRRYVTRTDKTQTYYYYQMRNFKASYNSVVMQDKVTTFDDIYKYISGVSPDYQKAFYTALGRERQGSSAVDMISILIKRQKNKQQLETGG